MLKVFLLSICLLFLISLKSQVQYPFQLVDMHVHCKGGFTIEDAVKKSVKEGIKYGIVVNCGIGFPIHNDNQIDSAITALKKYPQFLKNIIIALL